MNQWKQRRERRKVFDELLNCTVMLFNTDDPTLNSESKKFELEITWHFEAASCFHGYSVVDGEGSVIAIEYFVGECTVDAGDSITLQTRGVIISDCWRSVEELYEEFSP